MDFASLGQQATAMINEASVATPAAESSTVTSASPTPSAPQTDSAPIGGGQLTSPQATPNAAPATPGQPQTAEPTFQVDLGNGKIETLTQAQLREAYSNGLRQADYTRKTQELALHRQQLEAVAQQVWEREQLIRQALNTQPGFQNPQPSVPQVDPNQPITVGQLQPLLQGLQQQVAQQVTAAQQQAQAYVNEQLQVAEHAERFNTVLNDIYKDMPVLRVRPEFEDIIRFNVAKLQPQTEAEAIQFFKQTAKELNDSLSGHFTAQQQQQNSQRAQLVQQGIEPPGGVAPQVERPTYKTPDGKLDWTKLQQAAISMASGQ